MSRTYKDKRGREILPGAKIRHDNGRVEEILSVDGVPEAENLGIVAINPNYRNLQHPDWMLEYYGLHDFKACEWEIIGEDE